MPAEHTAKFKKAYEEVGALKDQTQKRQPTNDEQLNLYALAKIAEGKNFDEAKKPGMFDLAGKAKYNKWKEYVEEKKISKDQAEKDYIRDANKLIEECKA